MQLDPDDIEAVARRVLALLDGEPHVARVRLVDAGELAAALGVDRSWVYAHATELHAVRLSSPRVAFDSTSTRCSAASGRTTTAVTGSGDLRLGGA